MKSEIIAINDNMSEIGTSLKDIVGEVVVPIITITIGVGWNGVRMCTEGLAGGVDMLADKVAGKE